MYPYQSSDRGKRSSIILPGYLPKFKKIIPVDYERMFHHHPSDEEQGMSSEQAKIEAFYAIKGGR